MACVSKSVIAQISTIQWDKFSCPLDGHQLSANVVRPYVKPAAVAEKYQTPQSSENVFSLISPTDSIPFTHSQ
jgi:hypothetical protein